MNYTKEQLETRHKQAERLATNKIAAYLDTPTTDRAIRKLILPLITELKIMRNKRG